MIDTPRPSRGKVAEHQGGSTPSPPTKSIPTKSFPTKSP